MYALQFKFKFKDDWIYSFMNPELGFSSIGALLKEFAKQSQIHTSTPSNEWRIVEVVTKTVFEITKELA